MANISVAIAAHPKRRDYAHQLLDKLDGDVVAVWDDGDNEWDTHQRAWRAASIKADRTHCLVLQDDAVLCRDLIPALSIGLLNLPEDAIVSLYFGNARNHPKIVRAVNRANQENASWIQTSGTWWGVGIVIPTALVPGMLEFCGKRREVYDRRLSIWCEHGADEPRPVYYPWPSLIDHLDEDSLVIPGRPPGRKAFRFIGEDASAFDWNPDNGVVPCGRVMGRGIRLGK